MPVANEYKAEDVTRYVEGQAPGHTVTLAELVHTETVLSKRHEVWNVHTDSAKYWVVTDLTNLYDQETFPSHDYALSFHLGVMLRLQERQHREGEGDDEDHLERAWRRYTRAYESLDYARETEDFQAIGMRCREILLALSKELAERGVFDISSPDLQAGNFLEWSKRAAEELLPGSGNERLRRHFRDSCKNGWNLVSWLTHYQSANHFHADYALLATSFVLSAVSSLSIRSHLEPPETCPNCGSYQVATYWLSKSRPDSPGVVACAVCDWERDP